LTVGRAHGAKLRAQPHSEEAKRVADWIEFGKHR